MRPGADLRLLVHACDRLRLLDPRGHLVAKLGLSNGVAAAEKAANASVNQMAQITAIQMEATTMSAIISMIARK